MILRDAIDFTVECDVSDDFTRDCANTLVTVFSRYWLEGSERESVGVEIKGIEFVVRPKLWDA